MLINKSTENIIDYISQQLPKYNCSRCGFQSCEVFSEYLSKQNLIKAIEDITLCPFIGIGRFLQSKEKIINILNQANKSNIKDESSIFGVIDHLRADFVLSPYKNDLSCKEEIYPLDKNITLNVSDYISYRPLGCPITHFAKVLSIENCILTISIVGPKNRIYSLNENSPINIGLCLIIAFEGIFLYGRKPQIGQTVSFIPYECMMQKVHKGIVVLCEGKKIRIESIDLKI